MKNALVFFVLLICNAGNAQTPFIQWQKSLGGTSFDNGVGIVHTSDSGYMMVGTTGSINGDVSGNHGPLDIWVTKLTSAGSLVWQKCFGGTSGDYGQSIQKTMDGNFIIAGSAFSSDGDVTSNHGYYDYWVLKITPTGGIIWQKTYGGSGSEFLHNIRETSDSGFIVTGSSNSTDGDVTGNHGNYDMWVVRLSPTGSLIWQKSLGGTLEDMGGAAQQTPDGGFIIAGNTASNDGNVSGNHGGDDLWVVKLSSSGSILWQKTLGGSGMEDMTDEFGPGSVAVTADSGFIVAGWSNSTDGDVTGNHGSWDFWVVKLSDTGHIQWEKSFGGTADDEATCIEQTADGGYIVGGQTFSNDGDVSGNHGDYDYWLIKISDTGRLQWQKCLGGTGYSPNDCINSVHQTLGGGYIIAGFSNSNDGDVTGNHGDFDAWIVKLNCTMPHTGAITGPSVLCAGATITLADTAAGGVWISQSGTATVSGGVVTGISGGADIITYKLANTCGADFATKAVTINPAPVPVITLASFTLYAVPGYSSYQWNRNSSAISGATNTTYTATLNGYYSVTVTDTNGCTGTSLADTINNLGVPIPGYPSDAIHIIPNPANDVITITGIDKTNVTILNQLGQPVKQEDHINSLSVAGLPTGIYFISLYNDSGVMIHFEKILKR